MPKPVQFKVTKCDLKQTNQIQQKILVSRGLRVILDSDLAKLYGVTTKQLNQQLKRNLSRFPGDFAFQLTLEEAKDVARSRSQIVTLNRGTNIKHAPHEGRRVHEHRPAPVLFAFARSAEAVGLRSRRRPGNIHDEREGLRRSGESCRRR